MEKKEPSVLAALSGVKFAPNELYATVVRTNKKANGETWAVLVPVPSVQALEARLDEVAPGWELSVVDIKTLVGPKGGLQGFLAIVKLTIGGVARAGAGQGPSPAAALDAALRNAAAHFGLGRYLRAPEYIRNVRVVDSNALHRVREGRVPFEEAIELLSGRSTRSPAEKRPSYRAPAQPEEEEAQEEVSGEIPF